MTNHESLHSIKSNDQRLKSLEEYENEKQKKKLLIKDSVDKNLHVKFDSDEEDNQPKKFLDKKIQLFDDNEILNVEEHFIEKKTSKTKRKLQDLQTRLTTTNDPRFQFSEQFLDNNNNNNDEISFEEEKQNSLAILDQIAKPKKQMIRFDPSKTEHRIYEIESEKKDLTEEIPTKEILPPIVDSKRIYEFDQVKLKTMFNKTSHTKNTSNENQQFQFQFFNNKEEPMSLSIPKISSTSKSIINEKSKVFLNTPDDNISSDEDDQEKSLPDQIEIKNETFFFFDIDDRLKDGLENFVRTEDLNELERSWPIKRKEIGEALRTKHRKAIQRKDKHRIFNHRHRQKQYTSKSNID